MCQAHVVNQRLSTPKRWMRNPRSTSTVCIWGTKSPRSHSTRRIALFRVSGSIPSMAFCKASYSYDCSFKLMSMALTAALACTGKAGRNLGRFVQTELASIFDLRPKNSPLRVECWQAAGTVRGSCPLARQGPAAGRCAHPSEACLHGSLPGPRNTVRHREAALRFKPGSIGECIQKGI